MRTIALKMGTMAIVALMLAATADAQVRERAAPTAAVESRGRIGFAYAVGDGEGRVSVTQVVPDSPADEAGLRAGDVIVRWNGREDVLPAVLGASLQPGDTVTLRIRRGTERDRELTVVADAAARPMVQRITGPGGEEIVLRLGDARRQLQVLRDSLVVHADSMHSRIRILLGDSLGQRLEELTRNGRMHAFRVDSMLAVNDGLAEALAIGRGGVAGAELTDLGGGLATYFQTDRGALVLKVAAATPAARAGLQEGDVIVRAGGEDVSSVGDLRRVVGRAADRDLEVEVVRRGNRHILVLSR
ncbi:MAG: PDZ domain-containing protein [Gemmatimonadota bacterium]